ncbi:MAG: SDR family NAD(P)-dependent oxidoreductase [Candidatus Heimdallarchaeota archaeon]|nr:SDR family NAD(P)-dependent oxidoreductase [Candidatus Heimdallarchaeota archaeon]
MRSVLVTGASTGIGRVITEVLTNNEFFVYAGARKQKDLDDLNSLKNVKSVKLDVNDLDEISAAFEFIKSEDRGLFGLVNNAGVMGLQPLTEVSEDDFDWHMKTNVYGPFRVTKAFSSLLVESKGRIVNIGSVSGILSSALLGPYSMSKRAIDSFSDTLRSEVADFGCSVSIIESGEFDSEMNNKFYETVKKSPEKYLQTMYPMAKNYFENIIKDEFKYPKASTPLPVAQAVLDALTSTNPKPRYLVVPDKEQANMTIRKALQEALQLNYNHPYSYNREELISMIDEIVFDLEL